jgi:hypothetical protein
VHGVIRLWLGWALRGPVDSQNYRITDNLTTARVATRQAKSQDSNPLHVRSTQIPDVILGVLVLIFGVGWLGEILEYLTTILFPAMEPLVRQVASPCVLHVMSEV